MKAKPAPVGEQPEPEQIERHYRPVDLQALIGLPADTIRGLVRQKKLRAVHIGKAVLIPESAVRELLEGRAP